MSVPAYEPVPTQMTVNGVQVGSLKEAHDWAVANKPSTVIVAATGTFQMDHGLSWTYTCPGGLIINGGVYSGLDSSGTNGAPGWWLVYNPTIDPCGPDNPAKVPLRLNGVIVQGFVRGGLNISPTVNGNPTAGGKPNGGYINGVYISSSVFSDIGTGYSQDDSNNAVGYGAIFTLGVRYMSVTGSWFTNLVNDNLNPSVPGVRGPSLLHALYLNDHTTGTVVAGCKFTNISGDAVRVRNGSSVTVSGCTFTKAGDTANVSSWRNASIGEVPGTATLAGNKSDGLGYAGNPVVLWDPGK